MSTRAWTHTGRFAGLRLAGRHVCPDCCSNAVAETSEDVWVLSPVEDWEACADCGVILSTDPAYDPEWTPEQVSTERGIRALTDLPEPSEDVLA